MAKPGCRTGAKELYDADRAIGLAFKALEHGRYARTNHIQRPVKAGNLDGGTQQRWKLPQGGNRIPMNAGRLSDRNLDASWLDPLAAVTYSFISSCDYCRQAHRDRTAPTFGRLIACKCQAGEEKAQGL
jgi:hypothetical protein